MDFLISVLEQGLIYGIMALGVYITYKILDSRFPDDDFNFPFRSLSSAAFALNSVDVTRISAINCSLHFLFYLVSPDVLIIPESLIIKLKL